MNRILLISTLWLFIKIAAATVPATVDHSSLSLGQSLTLTIDVSNTSSDPELQILNNNFEVNGTNSSSQTSIINGHVSSQKKLIISLIPKNMGSQTIPAIQIGNDSTAPITINVTKPSDAEVTSQNKAVFLETKVNGQSSYIGVPVIYTVKLYYATSLANLRMANIDIKGATVQPLGKNLQYTEQIKGREYQVLEQKFQIIPTEAGTMSIPPARISGNMVNDNMGGMFQIAPPRPFNVTSKTDNLIIKAIPASIAANEWFPAKQVTINESQTNGTTIKVGQPLTRTITVQALGVPYTSIPEISLTTPNNVNAYPDKTVTTNSFSSEDILGSKVFKIAYIPTQAGTLVFPQTEIKWWDIKTNTQQTAVIPARTYTVLAENGQPATSPAATSSQVYTPAAVKKIPPTHSETYKPWFYIAIAVIVLWIITLLAVIILYRKKRDPSSNKPKPANETTLSLKQAVGLINRACHEKNVSALNGALIGWASLYWQKKVYTILDIRDLTNNEKLKQLLEQLNHTLYRGNNFTQFYELAAEISQIGYPKQDVQKNSLKELYPE